jgi:uncharacterized protein (DUF1697 family)
MTTRIGFLRAVNVGRRTVRMPELVAICGGLGYGEPWTFVNSGNVVFEAAGARSAIERAMEQALEDALGFECTTFVRSAAEVRAALAVQPFTMSGGDTYFITFLKQPLDAPLARELEQASNDFDTLEVHGRDVHWHMRGKSTDTKLKASVWRRLGEHASTSRNVTMLTKLMAKVDA